MDLSREVEAQKKRVAALNYLKSQGQDIKSNHDIVKDIDKKDNNRIGGDNTLELLFKQNVSSQSLKRVEISLKTVLIQQQKELHQQPGAAETNEAASTTSSAVTSSHATDLSAAEVLDLPIDWNAVYDKTSMKYYYWNKQTNITTWDKPLKVPAAEVKSTDVESSNNNNDSTETESEWMEKVHDASKQTYWLNKLTGEKRFDKNKPTKSKVVIGTTSSNSKTASNANTSSCSKFSESNKKRKYDIDPLDFTDGKGDSYGRITGDRMADSTAGGPLWQQRPYPAPGKILNKNSSSNSDIGTKSSIGPSSIFFKKPK